MVWMKAGWRTIRTSRTIVEVVPSHDVIEHRTSFDCPCHPEIASEVDEYEGEVYWRITHNSFDEFLDEDQTEPYIGI